MKNLMLKKISGAILAVSIMAALGQIQGFAQDEPGQTKNGEMLMGTELEVKDLSRPISGPTALEGTWNTDVTFRICATGAAVRSFPAMNMFIQGGTMQEFGVGAGVFRSQGFGVWQHLSGRNYYSTFRFFRFNPDGTNLGSGIAKRYLELSLRADSYTSNNTADFFDNNGTYTNTACSTEVGTRFR